jgi:sugar-specific transcriptional regulator TrmB
METKMKEENEELSNKAAAWHSKYTAKKDELASSLAKNKNLIRGNTEAIKKAHRRIKANLQQIEAIFQRFRSVKGRLSDLRETSRAAQKEKMRALKKRSENFKSSHAAEVRCVSSSFLFPCRYASNHSEFPIACAGTDDHGQG